MINFRISTVQKFYNKLQPWRFFLFDNILFDNILFDNILFDNILFDNILNILQLLPYEWSKRIHFQSSFPSWRQRSKQWIQGKECSTFYDIVTQECFSLKRKEKRTSSGNWCLFLFSFPQTLWMERTVHWTKRKFPSILKWSTIDSTRKVCLLKSSHLFWNVSLRLKD